MTTAIEKEKEFVYNFMMNTRIFWHSLLFIKHIYLTLLFSQILLDDDMKIFLFFTYRHKFFFKHTRVKNLFSLKRISKAEIERNLIINIDSSFNLFLLCLTPYRHRSHLSIGDDKFRNGYNNQLITLCKECFKFRNK